MPIFEPRRDPYERNTVSGGHTHRQSGGLLPPAAETLEAVDFIAAEDTRVSVKLLNHFQIKKPLVSYHEHNHITAGQSILRRLLAGESCGPGDGCRHAGHLRPGGGPGAAVRGE